MSAGPAAVRVRELVKTLRQGRGRARGLVRDPARRVLRPAGAERGREDHHRRDPRGPAARDLRRRRGARPPVGPRRAGDPGTARRVPAADGALGEARGRRDARAVPLVLPDGARPARGRAGGGAAGEGARARGHALRRPEAEARGGLRARRRAGAAVPRRAHDGARPAVAAAGVGDRQRLQAAGPHGGADHPLHGRGGEAVRPHRGHRPRPHHRAGHAARADPHARRRPRGRGDARGGRRPRSPRRRSPTCRRCARPTRRRATSCSRSPSRTSPCPRLLARVAERGQRLASLATRHASLEDVFVSLTGRHLRDE